MTDQDKAMLGKKTTLENTRAYALTIFDWCRKHPWAERKDFEAMLDRIEKQVLVDQNPQEFHQESNEN